MEIFSSASFSRSLVRLMGERSWTQKDLASASGLSQPSIHRYLEEKTEPKVSDLMAMATAFGVSLDVLVGAQPASGATHLLAGLAEWKEKALIAESKVQMLKSGMQGLLKKV